MTGGIHAIPVPSPVPAVTLSPSSLVFGKQNTGAASAPQKIVVTNFGTASLSFSNIGIQGDFAQNNNCGASLPGASSCTISVFYTPRVTGAETGTLTITDNAFTGKQTVALSGTGTAPVVGISPASLVFLPQAINSSSGVQLVFLSNTGTGPLVFSGSGIAVSGDFTEVNDCGGVLAAAKDCLIAVTFKPAAAGTRTGSLSVTSNAALQTVSLTGTGASAAPAIRASPESLVFSPQLINLKSSAQTVTLTNSGATAVSLTSTTVSGDFAKAGSCPASLGTGQSCTLYLTFTPSAAGTRSGTLTFTLSSGTLAVALTGTGVSTAMEWLVASPTSLAFNGYIVGDNPTLNVTITNTNGVPTGISQLSLSGSAAFTQSNDCGATLAARASCTVAVTFAPTVVGTFTGTITVMEGAGATLTIPLSGTAGTDGGGGN
jgi:hypothetical protein